MVFPPNIKVQYFTATAVKIPVTNLLPNCSFHRKLDNSVRDLESKSRTLLSSFRWNEQFGKRFVTGILTAVAVKYCTLIFGGNTILYSQVKDKRLDEKKSSGKSS